MALEITEGVSYLASILQLFQNKLESKTYILNAEEFDLHSILLCLHRQLQMLEQGNL